MEIGKNPFKKVRKPDLTKVGNWWAKDVVFWSFGNTLYVSVPFTFYLPRARELATKWKKGKVLVGGPGAYIQPEYVEKFAKVGTKEDLQGIEPLIMHNPFATYTSRGCRNNCSFCLSPNTPILMGDLSVKALRKVGVGDTVYGVARNTDGNAWFWKTTKTKVLAKMSRTADAYKVTMEDGRVLVCSGDHRWLTVGRGWKYTTDTNSHPQRKHLTYNDTIQSVGEIYRKKSFSDDYKKGYLKGMLDGDGCIWDCFDKRSGFESKKIRLALADTDGLERSREFVVDLGYNPTEIRTFYKGNDKHQEILEFTLSKKYEVLSFIDDIKEKDSIDYVKGYIAGIFDAEGCLNPTAKIFNKDYSLIEKTKQYLDILNIDCYIDKLKDDMYRIVIGKVHASLKLYQITDPAIKWKWKDFLDNRMPDQGVRVQKIEHIGKRELMDIETESGNFIANGFVSHNCAVRQIDGPFKELKNWTPRPMVCDNNFLACSKNHFNKAIDKLKTLPYVDIQGIEAKRVTKEKASRLAELKKVRLIIGFDNVKYENKVYDAIKKLQAEGIKDIETYVLFGYKNTVDDTLYRLNKSLEWGVRPFPMRYQPLHGKHSLTKGTYVDPNWDLYTLRKIMAYYANLTRYSHIPFEEFQLTKDDNSQAGFGL